MNIYALENHKIRCCTLNAGYDYHKELAEKYLEVGKEYTVLRTHIDSYHTDVVVKEIPDVKFNSVFFESIDLQPKEDNKKHPDYYFFNKQ